MMTQTEREEGYASGSVEECVDVKARLTIACSMA